MAASAVIELAGQSLTVRELTVAACRDWLREIEAGLRPVDPAGDALFEQITLGDLAVMCDADPDWLAGFTPSELQPLADLCRQVNPHFFRLRAVVQAAYYGQVRELLSVASAATSSAMSAASSSAATPAPGPIPGPST